MGQKLICPVSIEESYNVSKPIFNTAYNKFVEKYPDKEGSSDAIAYMLKKYSAEENILGELFSMWIEEHYPGEIHQNTVVNPKVSKDINITSFLELGSIIEDNIIDLYDDQVLIEEQDSNDGDNVVYDGNEDANSLSINLKQGGDKYFTNRLFSAINVEVSESELADISKDARENTFVDFITNIADKYKDSLKPGRVLSMITENDMFSEVEMSIIPNLQTLQKLKYFHTFNDPNNRMSRLTQTNKNKKDSVKKYYVITNYDGKNITLPTDLSLIIKPLIDFRTKRKLSLYLPASLLDKSEVKLPYGKKVGNKTAYLSLNDMVTMDRVKRGPRKGEWFAKQAQQDYSKSQLNDWLKIMLRQENLTIATIRGGNSGTMLLTYVDNYYYDTLFPVETVKNLLPQMPQSFKNRLSRNKQNNFIQAYRDYEKYVLNKLAIEGIGKKGQNSSLVSDFNQLFDLQQKLAIVNYLKYLQQELKDGNIDESSKKFFEANITDLPVATEINPVTKMNESYLHMGEYLASIIARHEWLKAVRGKRYAINENLENIFNRMRLAASEGLVNLQAGDTKVLIYNEKEVDYIDTETGKKISPQTVIRGMKDVDNDDGQLHGTSEDLNTISSHAGRRKIMDYEHDPKEIKTVSYHLEQSKDIEVDDNFIELKSMLFLAEPNFQVVEKATGLVILTTSKDVNGNVNITAGAATDIPGQSLDRYGSRNAMKTSSGKYSIEGKTHMIETIPASATRTIILPATKSKSDAALGGTWASSFNIDSPTFNAIRDILDKEFLSILDKSISKLHKIRTSPSYARKLLRYQTKVRDDATSEVKALYSMSGGKGLYHPMFWNIFNKSLFNTYILDDGMKLKLTVDRSNPKALSTGMSSSAKMKGDMKGRIGLDKDGIPEGVIIGTGQDRTFNYVSDIYKQEVSKEVLDEFNKSTPKEKLIKINNYLKENTITIGIVRQPVQHAGGYIFRNILNFTEEAGSVVLLHPIDVAKNLIGDSDGDTANMVIWPNKQRLANLQALLKDPSIATVMDISSDLNVFEPAEKTHPASYNGFVDTTLSVINNFNGMGIITNLKTVAGLLELKIGDNIIEFSDGVQVTVIKALDQVVMDYAPLKDTVTKEDLPSFTRIVNKDGSAYDGKGKKYLKTIAMHERLLLLNAATDNTKEHLISKKWKIDLKTVASRIFKTNDNSPLKDTHVKILKKVLDFFNRSPLRNGIDPKTRLKLSDEAFYDASKDIHTFLNMSDENREESLKSFINQGKFGKKEKLTITSIPVSNIQSTEEKILARPYEKFLQDKGLANISVTRKSWGEDFKTPTEFSKTFQKNVNIHALNGFKSDINDFEVKSLSQKVEEYMNENNLFNENTLEAIEAADNFLVGFETDFREALSKSKKGKVSKKTESPTAKVYEYNEEMFNFVERYKQPYDVLSKEHGEVFKIHVTFKMFTGLGPIKNVGLYYPSDYIHPQTFKMYMESYETLHQAKDKETGLDLLSSEVTQETSKIRVIGTPYDSKFNCD